MRRRRDRYASGTQQTNLLSAFLVLWVSLSALRPLSDSTVLVSSGLISQVQHVSVREYRFSVLNAHGLDGAPYLPKR